ncbi:CYTH domain-containing protein [Candidatus Kaiserbacteria bacterium]|nr:MAG: CYTH domain-containing protein [Candidatus Kaiserbacteria bacterium]
MYEIEVKSLLGTQERADELRKKLIAQGGVLAGSNSQLNHYFKGTTESIFDKMKDIIMDGVEDLQNILTKGENHSVRTRKKDDDVILVVKASIDDGTSENAVSRMEYETKVPLSIEELDNCLLNAGMECQARWSRDREEYTYKDLVITLDKNAGYGWLSEFEKVVTDEAEAEQARAQIISAMKEFDIEELPQDRLERMFSYYNEHWPEYYGTDKIFIVE